MNVYTFCVTHRVILTSWHIKYETHLILSTGTVCYFHLLFSTLTETRLLLLYISVECCFGLHFKSVYLRSMSLCFFSLQDHCTVTYSLKNGCFQSHLMIVFGVLYFLLTTQKYNNNIIIIITYVIRNLNLHFGLFPSRHTTLSSYVWNYLIKQLLFWA